MKTKTSFTRGKVDFSQQCPARRGASQMTQCIYCKGHPGEHVWADSETVKKVIEDTSGRSKKQVLATVLNDSPWTFVSLTSETEKRDIGVRTATGRWIIHYERFPQELDFTTNVEEDEALCRLISAAPDMLEALELMSEMTPSGRGGKVDCRRFNEIASAAATKAKE